MDPRATTASPFDPRGDGEECKRPRASWWRELSGHPRAFRTSGPSSASDGLVRKHLRRSRDVSTQLLRRHRHEVRMPLRPRVGAPRRQGRLNDHRICSHTERGPLPRARRQRSCGGKERHAARPSLACIHRNTLLPRVVPCVARKTSGHPFTTSQPARWNIQRRADQNAVGTLNSVAFTPDS